MSKQSATQSNGLGWVAGVVAIAAAIGGAWYLNRDMPAPVAVVTPPPAEPIVEAQTEAPPIQHPIEAAVRETPEETPAEPLPALHESDAALLDALVALLDADSLGALLNHEFMIQRIVATVDALPRTRVAPQIVPLRPVPGKFAKTGDDATARLDPANYARYAPYIRVAESVDARKIVDVYVRFYPLFQQAYRELGVPDGYFNDRLVEVIDHLLVAPDVEGPIALVRPKVFYEYADPGLQERSAGHRLLIRMGPDNAAKLKAKLREIRTELTSTPPAVADAPDSP